MSDSYYGQGVGLEFPMEYGQDSMGEEYPGEMGQLDAAAAGPQFVRRDPRIEDLMLGSERVTIPAGQSGRIIVNPKLPFRAARMMIAGNKATDTILAANALAVESIDIAAIEQVLSQDPVNGAVYGPDATHFLSGNVMVPGNGATVRIRNIGTEDVTVQVIFFGEATRPEVPQSLAVPLLQASSGADISPFRASRIQDLVAASPIFTITSPGGGVPGPDVTLKLDPKRPFRARRMMVLDTTDADPGLWPYPAPPPGEMLLTSLQIATLEQVIAEPLDCFIYQPNATHKLKGTIMQPGNGAYMTLRPLWSGAVDPESRTYQIVFFGPAD